jgi:hypothetical protein
MEYCANNHVDQVLIGLPFIDRYELPTADDDVKIEGPYIQSTTDAIRDKALEIYIDIGNNSTYYALDRYITELIGFAGWLDQQKIDYLIWDMSNNFKSIPINDYVSIDKIKYIKQNTKIIDLFSFCGNLYLDSIGAYYPTEESSVAPQHRHYSPIQLKNYIDNYLKKIQ